MAFRGCLVGLRGSPGALAVDRYPRSWWKDFRGAKSQESNGPVAARAFGRKLEQPHGCPVNGFSEGARLRSGRSGNEPASPKDAGRLPRLLRVTVVDRWPNDREESRSRPLRRVSGPFRGFGGAARGRRRDETGREIPGAFAPEFGVESLNPQGSKNGRRKAARLFERGKL